MVTDLTFDPPLGVKWNFWGQLFFLSAKGVNSSVLKKVWDPEDWYSPINHRLNMLKFCLFWSFWIPPGGQMIFSSSECIR